MRMLHKLHTLRTRFHVFHKYGKQHFNSTPGRAGLCVTGGHPASGQGVCMQNNMKTAANVFPLNSLDIRSNQIFSLGTLMKH